MGRTIALYLATLGLSAVLGATAAAPASAAAPGPQQIWYWCPPGACQA